MNYNMLNIYHNPRCRKSREALEFLINNNINFEVINYLKDHLTEVKLSSLINKLKIKPIDLIRKNESIWKDNYKRKELSDNEILQILITNPKLIERPIIETNDVAIIARPIENLINFFTKK